MSNSKTRVAAAALSLSAVAGLGWIKSEGEGPKSVSQSGEVLLHPYVPTQGDVPTIGHGSTHYEDGRRVTLRDPPITRQRAAELALGELDRTYAKCVRDSLGQTLVNQTEFDKAADFAGQYGCGAWRGSSMLTKTKARDYAGACRAYLNYKFMTSARREGPGWVAYQWDEAGKPTRWRFDCSTPGNKVCGGVWTRQQGRYNACMEAQP
ncbi:glycoside hydrolase family protein [Comamonas thiooxydans]|uniref:glycoside hydrolase family protein n=1 Tax=Comamonas thiooxydans TaxID=363952 RepID=UPI00070E0E41|nr:glycoside hydrolase family protein [Comamonas thiooxydans]